MAHPFDSGEIDDLGSFVQALFGPHDQPDPPAHWVSMDIKLQNNQRSVSATIPHFMCQQVGLERDDLPEVTVYYDPHTDFVFFDLGGRFDEEADVAE